jgi:UDP-sulfoquinovose synthase
MVICTEKPANLFAENDWCQLREWVFPGDRINLNPGTLGTSSKFVLESQEVFLEDSFGAYPLGQYGRGRLAAQSARKLASALWGLPEKNIAFAGSATQIFGALCMSLYAYLGRSGKKAPFKVLTSRHEHSGAIYGFEKHPGYEVHYLEDHELFDHNQFQEKFNKARPDLVLLSSVTYDLGWRLPLETAKKVNQGTQRALLIVDATQEIGISPRITTPESGEIDIVVTSTHKWLLGPTGTGMLWLTHELGEALAPYYSGGHSLDPSSNLGAFEPSGGCDFSKFLGLKYALDLYSTIGPGLVLQRSRELTLYFQTRVSRIFEDRHIKMEPSFNPEYGGSLTLSFQNWDPYPLYDFLNQHRIHLKCIKVPNHIPKSLQLIRIGIPYFETKSRLDQVLEKINDFTLQSS